MANIIKFDCLTGLRPAKAVEAVRLINNKDAPKYYKPERQACCLNFQLMCYQVTDIQLVPLTLIVY
jgi:hypothetical protein